MEAVIKILNMLVNTIGSLVNMVVSFVASIDWEKFDVRHYMAAGFVTMIAVMTMVSGSLQARVINPGVNLACAQQAILAQRSATLLKNEDPVQAAPIKNAVVMEQKAALVSQPDIPTNFKLKFGKNVNLEKQKLTRLTSLKMDKVALKFSPKDRVSCSVDAAHAAANGDPTKVGSCIDALFSGDYDTLVTMPERIGSFFIETMNSDIPEEKKANIFINSMMQMMERMSSESKDGSPEKTAATDK